MKRAEALRSIRDDLLEYIQKKVEVDFDNVRQMPVSFMHEGRTHRIGEVLGHFQTRKGLPANAFLVNADGDEVYFLYFHLRHPNQDGVFHAGHWVLSFRVLRDRELMAFYREERKLLIDTNFKRVVDFHGHTCPDLVLGGKLCEYVQKLISSNGKPADGISIIAENSTSALDAIQILLGTTVGNQRLQVIDFGKHNYTLLSGNEGKGFRLTLKRQHYDDEEEYNSLDQKMQDRQVTLDEVVQFQKLLDVRVKYLMGLCPEDLYQVKPVKSLSRPVETTSVCLICARCGQQVLKSRIVNYEGKAYCLPCFQRLNTGCTGYGLQ